MRLLLLAVLALAAVALGATREPHEGCDYDFGAGNGTAYLVVNNPYNLKLSLNITYQRGEYKYSEVRNVPNTRVIVFCGLGHGWLYIQQNTSRLMEPLAWYPLAVPRYVVLRAGESATMFVITLLAPAAIIAVVFFLLVAIKLKPKLKRSAVYALPDELRGLDIREHVSILLFVLFIAILLIVLLVYEPSESAFLDITSLAIMFFIHLTSSLGGFYLSFRRGVWTYHFLLVSFLVNIYLIITFSKSYYLLLFLYFILFITIILTSSVTLFSLYNLFMTFFLFTYGIAVLIYYNVNFGHIIPSNLPWPIMDILPWSITDILLSLPSPITGIPLVPEVLAVSFPAIVVFGTSFLIFVFLLVYGLTLHARATTPHMSSWPPLWWWFGLGLFAWVELEARRHLHRLSADYTVVVELSRGERAIVVSADLYGVYLCRFGKRSGICNNVEWVPYDKVEIKASKIINKKIRNEHVVNKVALLVLLVLVYILTFFIIKYVGLPTVLIIPFYLVISILPYIYNCLKIKKNVKQIYKNLKKYIKEFKNLKMHIFYISHAFAVSFIFGFLASDFLVSVGVFIATITISFRLIKDPELHSYLYPDLELRLMSVGGLVVGLARGGCLRWTKVGVAPLDRAFAFRDGDCLVVVTPYVENVKSRLQNYLCGPACPPVRVVVDEELQDLMKARQLRSHKKQVQNADWRRVAVGILNLRKRRYYYYIVDFPR